MGIWDRGARERVEQQRLGGGAELHRREVEMEAGGSDLDWIWAAAAIGRRGLGFRGWTRMRGIRGDSGGGESDKGGVGFRWIWAHPTVLKP